MIGYEQKLARVLDRMGATLPGQRHPDRDRRGQDAELRRSTIHGRSPRCRTSRAPGNCSSSPWLATSRDLDRPA